MKEVEEVVNSLPNAKAPGPDGFTGFFLKKCWHIVKWDFYDLCRDFWMGQINLQSINDSFITLIPKVTSPEGPNDFRPISLLNCCLKFVTKVLANRLQSKIKEIVHVNQYGFIKSRTIQDCVSWAYEYIHQCKQTQKECIILKLDFAKAFDTIEHSAILKILKHKGFDDRWLGWMDCILKSGSSSILLNGTPGIKFACKRGVRQGDPLSPTLFVAGSDLLQSMVNFLFNEGTLIAPLPIPGSDFPIIQYVDDTLLVMQACPNQLVALKGLLHEFAAATGLHVNYNKSCILPINVSEDKMMQLASVFDCSIGSLPFTYLGLPLGTARPMVKDLAPVTDQIERRLNGCMRFLPIGGKLQIVNSVMLGLSTFLMCTLKLHKTFIKSADRARRHCLWDKREDSTSFAGLAAWDMVCKPKNHGGLGVINLELQNMALLLKQLHKFFSKEDIPWVKLVWSLYSDEPPQSQSKRGSFWWRDVFSFAEVYRSITNCQVGDGSTILFWKDFWLSEDLLLDKFPRLFSFVEKEDMSVRNLNLLQDPSAILCLPLSPQAYDELQELRQLCDEGVTLSIQPDTRTFTCGKGKYASSDFYKFMFQETPKDKVLKRFWKSKSVPKIKVFCWLLINDRLNTKDMMLRKHWQMEGGSDCVLCNKAIMEDNNHLFFDCDFASSCWDFVGVDWDRSLPIRDRLMDALDSFPHANFIEIFAYVAWNIWKMRNDLIFRLIPPSLDSWKYHTRRDLLLLQYRVKAASVQAFLSLVALLFP